jgi:hypothetical protein
MLQPLPAREWGRALASFVVWVCDGPRGAIGHCIIVSSTASGRVNDAVIAG